MSSDAPATDSLDAELERYCPQCGYDLRWLPSGSDRCPECGTQIDRATPSILPWANRRATGVLRAYWRTCMLATFRTKQLAREIGRPVSYRDARLFQLMTVLIAWAPPAALIVSIEVMLAFAFTAVPSAVFRGAYIGGTTETSASLDFVLPWLAAFALYVPLPRCFFLFLLLST